MNLVGDLERLFATSLYPLRVPIGIGLALAFVALVLVARRRGWFAAARRHPRRTGSLAIVALVVGLPIGWYLASPLVIRTQLIEPVPVALAEPLAPPVGIPSKSPGAATADPASPTPPPTPAATPFESSVQATGPFNGADDFHFGEGTASVIETAPGRFTLRFEAFSVRNGPDLYVYLSPDRDGYAAGALELGALKATDGAFSYELPAGTDPLTFESAVIWCKQFAVLFAVAPLSVG
jgi:hypothetical protein